MLKHVSEYIPGAVMSITDESQIKTIGQQLPSVPNRKRYIPVSVGFPIDEIDTGIFSDFDGVYTAQMAENMLDLAQIAREAGSKLTKRDEQFELSALNLLKSSIAKVKKV